MLCNVCKKEQAKVHLTQMVEGKIQKVDLCEACAKEKGVDDPTGFSLADLLLGLGASQELSQVEPKGDAKCPRCGFTHADFKKTGRLGCAGCYESFSEALTNMLKSMHKGTRHVGKVPELLKNSLELEERSLSLQERLDKAVAEENFEQAAVLRDELKIINQQLSDLKPD